MARGIGVVARRVAPLVGAAGSAVGLDVSPAMLAVAAAAVRPPFGQLDEAALLSAAEPVVQWAA